MAPSLSRLFLTFLRLGCVAFGGPAMVACIRRWAVEKRRWLGKDEFDDGVALCQVIPGATAMQMAAYVGLAVHGLPGAAVCYAGFVLPSFFAMLAIAALYERTHELPAMLAVFSGLRVIVVAIVANATMAFGKDILKDWRRVLIAVVAAALFSAGTVLPFGIIVLAGCLGAILVKAAGSPPGEASRLRPLGKQILVIMVSAAVVLAVLWWMAPSLFDLAIVLGRIDLLAFGGGYASVPLMLQELVINRRWLDETTFMDGIVLGQVTPGPIVITATFAAYLWGGLVAAVVATISVFLPSFLLVLGLAPLFNRFRGSPLFRRIIAGIFCSFVGLLFSVTLRFAANTDWNVPRLVLAAAAVLALRWNVDILWVVLAGAVVSIFWF